MVDTQEEYKVKTFSKFGVWYPLVVFLVATIAIALVSAVAMVIGYDLLHDQDLLLILNSLLFALLGVGAWIGWKRKGLTIKEIFSLKHVTKKTIVLTVVAFALLQPFLVIISTLLNTFGGLEITGNSGEIVQDKLSIIKMLAIMVVAPLFEEIFFRGVLFDGFLNTFRKIIPVKDSIRVASTIAFTAMFFGLMHLTTTDLNGFVSVGTTAILGLVFAILRVKTGSLALNVLAHFTFNSVGFALIAISYFVAS